MGQLIMGQLIIDDPHGFDTIFSTDLVSPAAPYLREYHPRSLEDLYEIGVIPKHVPIDVLRKAKWTLLIPPFTISPLKHVGSMSKAQQYEGA